MSSKPKAATKKPKSELSEVPGEHRRQHTPFTRDVLTPPGAPVIARHRTRTILTPLAVRLAILEEAGAKPEAVRVRSLRRRLTALDRALSDREAEALERFTSCINALSNTGCISYLRSEVRSNPFGRLPFSERKQREIAAMTYVLRGLRPAHKTAVLELAACLDPSHSQIDLRPGEAFVAAVQSAAGPVLSLYDGWFALEKSRHQETKAVRKTLCEDRGER
jgi:hypothetical protein